MIRAVSGRDPYADSLLAAPSRAVVRAWGLGRRLGLPTNALTLGLEAGVIARHRFIDEALVEALRGGVRQVVLLGAGYDARPWRFAEWGARVFEVDHPATAAVRARRAQRLRPSGSIRVQVDFARDDFAPALLEAGLDPERPSFFVWEGVSMYLPATSVQGTLRRIGRLGAPGSRVAFDLIAGSMQDSGLIERAGRSILNLIGEPLVFSVAPDELPRLLEDAGLRCLEFVPVPQLCQRYGLGPGHRLMSLVHAEVQ